MPHATDENDVVPEVDDDEAIRRFLQGNNNLGGLDDGDAFNREFDQTGKDADAIDYEDISDDDDLPEEEEGTNQVDGNDHDPFYGSIENGLPIQVTGTASADHQDGLAIEDDILDGDDVNDLFDEEKISASGTDGHNQTERIRSGTLAPPTRSSLALPVLSASPQPMFSNGASPSAASDDGQNTPRGSHAGTDLDEDGDDDASEQSDEDEATRMQRALFKAAKRRGAGLVAPDEEMVVDFARFYTLFPEYEKEQNPRFIEFFPSKPVHYKGKVPLKPPKPVQATKVTLDLLPDQERTFRAIGGAAANANEPRKSDLIFFGNNGDGSANSDEDLAFSAYDESEVIAGVSMQDLALICEDWDFSEAERSSGPDDELMGNTNKSEDHVPPKKRLKLDFLDSEEPAWTNGRLLSYEHPEEATARVARDVALDLNDPNLLIDEHAAPTKRRMAHFATDAKSDSATKKNLLKRYNISNDEAYDLLKENHQHKIRSTLGSMAVEHSMPANKLQYPFYKVALDAKAKRNFHRPSLHNIDHRREYRFQRLRTVKRKERRGRDIKELFSTAESLSQNDNANMLLLEYSEEAPTMLSNFGMGNRLINYYRKRNADDQDRPKRDIGETQVLLTQDKSPFANFGHVDQGEIVPTIQNAMYRAPVFQHAPKSHDFFMSISTTHSSGSRLHLRNVENLHTVGQQFPLLEVPGEHSRKVTDAAKKRLRALSYRIYTKSQDPNRKDKQLDNATVMQHLKGHDMPQTRSKMREFMDYERLPNRDGGVWVPKAGHIVPDADTLRGWVKPEDVCLLDSMQVGVQRLNDLGLATGKEADDDKEDGGGSIESQLAPWRTTKNFLNATQGKAMLKLHGEGDPTGRGEGFSFVRTSMKGGFQALGESAEDKIDAKKRREAGGHSYNVAKQQKAYDDYIRMIWDRQKQSLSNDLEVSDGDFDDEPETDVETPYPYSRARTPRSAIGTPAAFSRRDDESASQFSRGSTSRSNHTLVIKRISKDYAGEEQTRIEHITDPKVISLYKKRRMEKRVQDLHTDLMDIEPTGDPQLDAYKKLVLEKELARVYRNIDRRHAREKAKGKVDASPGPASIASPGPSEIEGVAPSADGTPANASTKGRGRNKDATARKCANCGQVGHIKTNRKLCPMLNGTMRPEDINPNGDSSFGAVPAPLKL